MDKKLEEIKNENGTYSVYLLSCNKTPDIVYIGITNNKYVIERLFRHFEESVNNTSKNINKHKWILDNWRNIDMSILESNIESDETARIREAQNIFKFRKEGKNVLNITYVPVRCYDGDGNFYKDYASYAEAAKDFETQPCRIMGCVTNKLKFLKEFTFVKWENNLPDKIEVQKHNKNTINSPVLQYSKEGYFIREWKSPIEICDTLQIDRSQMTKCLKDFSKTARNFHFLYKGRTIETYLCPDSKIKVIMYDLQGNEIGKFKSMKACALYLIEEGITNGQPKNIAAAISKNTKENRSYLNRVFTIL